MLLESRGLGNSAWEFLFIFFLGGEGEGGLIFVPGIFLSFDFFPHSIIPVI